MHYAILVIILDNLKCLLNIILIYYEKATPARRAVSVLQSTYNIANNNSVRSQQSVLLCYF